ncbi:zinc finger protein [Trichonephila clavata]|uniref:Zinc finger protein n=1 Tax=Trichonephila clavata TaxID=2740835 RepID=A0A8X6FZ65_TRICU|nr:zinc finger protein [Trichonephila clavata]
MIEHPDIGVLSYHQMDIEHFHQFTGVEQWNFLPAEDFQCNPSKMMNDHSLISDAHMDHEGFSALKTQGLEEVALDGNHVTQLLFQDVQVPNDLIIEGGVEVENGNPHGDGDIMIVRNFKVKQEDLMEGGEIIVNDGVDNEVIIPDQMDSQLDAVHFEIGSSIDIDSEQIDETGFDDSKLIIDTDQYCLEEEPPCVMHDCSECGVVFKSKTTLKKHMKSNHTKVQRNKPKKNSSKEKHSNNKRYNCPSCPYTSQHRDKLDKHMEKHVLHDGVHPCGKRRHKPDALPQRHRHNAEEYKCRLCPYSCTVFKAMKKHQKVHASGNTTFILKLSCKICGKDRTTEPEMQKHMRKHKKGDSYFCDMCDFNSVQLKKIIQHRRMHTGEKPHLCPHCGYRSARRDNLRSHVRRMHQRPNMYIDTFNPKDEIAVPF